MFRRISTIIGLLIIIVAIGAAVGFYIYQSQHKPGSPNTVTTPQPDTPTPSGNPSVTPTSSTSAGSRCATADLTLSLGNVSGAAGTQHQSLALKNTSNRSCSLFGYPGASLLDANGSILGQPAQRDAARAPRVLTLTPGQSAYFTLSFPNAGNFEPGKCTANASTLRIFPPDQTQSLQVALQRPYCPGFSITALTSTPQP